MSNDRVKPTYNLRRRHNNLIYDPTEQDLGFIRASELIKRAVSSMQSSERPKCRNPGPPYCGELGHECVHETDTTEQKAASHEVVPDVSPNGSDEGASERATEAAQASESTGDQGLSDSTGEAQGQQPTPPHSPMVEEETEHNRPTLLRLRVQEAWKLHNNEVWIRQCQLSEEGGFHASCVWNDTRALYELNAEGFQERNCWQTEEAHGCDSDILAIGVFTRRHNERVPRVLLVEQKQGGQLVYHVAEHKEERIITTMASKPFVSRNKLFYTTPRRVVQIEYQLQESFQTEAALLVWASEQPQDQLPSSINAILFYLRHSDGRGLVRPLYGPRTAAMLYRRIQGAKEDTVAKRVPARKRDAPQKKVRVIV